MVKLKLTVLLFCLTACAAVSNKTLTSNSVNVSGIISERVIWKGDVNIEKDLMIAEKGEVVVLGGTRVFIAKSDIARTEPIFLYPETEIMVKGKLVIKGEKDNPVTFQSLENENNNKAWAGIVLQGGEIEGEYFDIKDAYAGISALSGNINISKVNMKNDNAGLIIFSKAKGELKNITINNCQTGVILDNDLIRISDINISECSEGILIKSVSKKSFNLNIFNNNFGVVIASKYLPFLLGENKIYENKNNLYIFDTDNSFSK